MDNFNVGVVVFPGSNCDRDVSWALEGCLDIRTKYLWHESSDLSDVDAIAVSYTHLTLPTILRV